MSTLGDPKLPQRFWAKVSVGPSGCWEWAGGRDSHGYGHIKVQGRMRGAHRLAFEALVRLIPGLEVDHLCRNRSCVNPDHMEAVTHRENSRRSLNPAGINARKTHCQKGHEFTPENTRVWRNQRNCRTCEAARGE